jgi:hypothetical protein
VAPVYNRTVATTPEPKPVRGTLRTVDQAGRRLSLSRDAVTELCDAGELEAGDMSPQRPTDRCKHCSSDRASMVHLDAQARGHHQFVKARRRLRITDDSLDRFEERRIRELARSNAGRNPRS